jgi:hypothetical protein
MHALCESLYRNTIIHQIEIARFAQARGAHYLSLAANDSSVAYLSIFYRHFTLTTQALVEILLLSGGTPHANSKDLAHAWGHDKGFHHTLANAICERRGAVERKRRSDAGKRLTPEERIPTKNQTTDL